MSLLVIWATLLLAPAAEAAVGASRPTSGTPVGSAWLRLGHLAPATGPVDVWLTPFGGTVGAATLSGVRYGSVSTYRPLAPGFYTVAMRPAGSPAAAPAMVSATLRLTGAHAYSALAEGTGHTLTVRLTDDDLSAPAPGRARVRLIQAATRVPEVDVRVVHGPVLAVHADYASETPYAQVPQGRWTVQLTAGGFAATTELDVAAGSVSTVLVLDGPGGSPILRVLTDASGTASMPTGGVNAGAGGTAGSGRHSAQAAGLTADGSSPRTLVALLAGIVCAGAWLVGARLLRVRRRAGLPT